MTARRRKGLPTMIFTTDMMRSLIRLNQVKRKKFDVNLCQSDTFGTAKAGKSENGFLYPRVWYLSLPFGVRCNVYSTPHDPVCLTHDQRCCTFKNIRIIRRCVTLANNFCTSKFEIIRNLSRTTPLRIFLVAIRSTHILALHRFNSISILHRISTHTL